MGSFLLKFMINATTLILIYSKHSGFGWGRSSPYFLWRIHFATYEVDFNARNKCLTAKDLSCKFSKLQYNSLAFVAGFKRATDEGSLP